MGTLSKWFDLEDVSRSTTADRLGIDNTPPESLMPRVIYTAQCMDEVRGFLGYPVHVNSWLRLEDLEYAINKDSYEKQCAEKGILITPETWAAYFARKSHPLGEAVDFTCKGFGIPEKVFAAIKNSGLFKWDQLILEFADGTGRGWVHISFVLPPKAPRGHNLIIDSKGTRNV